MTRRDRRKVFCGDVEARCDNEEAPSGAHEDRVENEKPQRRHDGRKGGVDNSGEEVAAGDAQVVYGLQANRGGGDYDAQICRIVARVRETSAPESNP